MYFSCLFYVENAQMNNNTFDNDDDDDDDNVFVRSWHSHNFIIFIYNIYFILFVH